MSRALRNRNITGITLTRKTRPSPVNISPKKKPTAEETIQSLPEETIQSLPEVKLFLQVNGLRPFLTQQLLPDIIDMYQWAGISYLVDSLKLYESNESNQPLKEFKDELADLLFRQGLEILVGRIQRINSNITEQQINDLIQKGGLQGLAEAVDLADSNDPDSIIFNHPSQKVFEDTLKVELDMILNEPEVIEREDITCTCGGKKIQTIMVQVRSSDEAPDVIARCVSCKRRWKFRG